MTFDIHPYRGFLAFSITDHNTDLNLGMLDVKEARKVAKQLKEALAEVNQYIEAMKAAEEKTE
jgi:hypothetical protein